MKDMKCRNIKLYDLIFPIWLLWIFPITWLIILPANFVVDLLVTFFTLKVLGVTERKSAIKKSIWKTWIFGFIADIGGAACLFLGLLLFPSYETDFDKWWNHHIAPIGYNPFDNIFSFLYVLVAVGIAAFLIYIFNLKICLKKTELDEAIKKKLALSLAVFTAPYLYFLPTGLFV